MATTDTKDEDFLSRKRVRSANLSQLTKLYNELERNMCSFDNNDYVRSLYKKIVERFDQFKSAHLQCLDLCTETDVANILIEHFDSCQKNFVEFQERYTQWVTAGQRPTPEDDDRSHVSSATCTSRTSVSSQDRLRNARAKRLIAELKLEKLSKRQELERAQRELELKQQLFEQQCVVDEAALEESVWQQAVNEDTDTTTKSTIIPVPLQSSTRETVYRPEATVIIEAKVRPEVSQIDAQDNLSTDSTRAETNDVSSRDAAFQQLANTLQEGFNLPKPELLTFNGTPADYCKFISNFETNIGTRVSDDRLRLSYLIQYCNGEAKSCIEDCVLLEPSEGYERARSILYSRYGRPHVIARSYIDKLVDGPQIRASDTDGLSRLALEMQKCEITLSKLGFASDVDNTENLRRIVKRLPMHLRAKWVDVAHSINEPASGRHGREPRFSDLAKFVDEKSRIASSMYGLDLTRENSQFKGSKGSPSKQQGNGEVNVNTLVITSENQTVNRKRKCGCCSGTCFKLSICDHFKTMSITDRYQLVHKLKLCYNCLKGKHVSRYCRKQQACTVPGCKQKHHGLLHNRTNESNGTATLPSVSCAASYTTTPKICLGIIPVVVNGMNGTSCKTYALLDDGADKTLCDERLLDALNVSSRPVTFNISTVRPTDSTTHGQEVDLQVQGVNSNDQVNLHNVWSVKRLPISVHSAVVSSDIKKLSYLKDIDVSNIDTKDVMLLIGTDSPAAHIPLEVRSGKNDQPYAIRTRLGWAIRGPVGNTNASDKINVNFQQSSVDILSLKKLESMCTTDFDEKLGTRMKLFL